MSIKKPQVRIILFVSEFNCVRPCPTGSHVAPECVSHGRRGFVHEVWFGRGACWREDDPGAHHINIIIVE